MILTPGQALDPNSAASSGEFNPKVIKNEESKIINSLFIYNDLFNYLAQAVFKDHGVNTTWHGPQVDYFL